MFYTNETIVLSRAGQTDATIAAADKAIAADPNKPIPYYLKGQALISESHRRPQDAEDRRSPGHCGGLQQVPRTGAQRAHGAGSEIGAGGDWGEDQHQVQRRARSNLIGGWKSGRRDADYRRPFACIGANLLNSSAPSRVVSYAEASRIVREHADRLVAPASSAVRRAARYSGHGAGRAGSRRPGSAAVSALHPRRVCLPRGGSYGRSAARGHWLDSRRRRRDDRGHRGQGGRNHDRRAGTRRRRLRGHGGARAARPRRASPLPRPRHRARRKHRPQGSGGAGREK